MYNRIKELRIDKDIKQIEIATILNISQAQYSYIENNKFQLDYENLIKLAIFYNTSIDLFTRSYKSKITLSSRKIRA